MGDGPGTWPKLIEVSATGAAPDVAARLFEARIPLSRHACAEEIARCVLFLACADSSFMTGATVPVDGRMHVWPLGRQAALGPDAQGPVRPG